MKPIVSLLSPAQPEPQKVLSEQITYGPINRNAVELLPARLAGSLPASPPNLAGALRINTAFWIEHGDALERRFNAWAPAICRQQDDEDDDDYFDLPVCQDVQGNMRDQPRIGQRQPNWPAGQSQRSVANLSMTMNDTMRFTPDRIEVRRGKRFASYCTTRDNCATNSSWASQRHCVVTRP